MRFKRDGRRVEKSVAKKVKSKKPLTSIKKKVVVKKKKMTRKVKVPKKATPPKKVTRKVILKKDILPKKVTVVSQKKVTPQKKVTRKATPQKKVQTPQKKQLSPPKKIASPQQKKILTPYKKLSPRKKVTPPKKAITPPRIVSPKRVTPPKKAMTPPRPATPKSSRRKEYDCYKITDRTSCESSERCLWDNSWSNFFSFRNKCKSRLFHDLKINYPAKPKDYKKILDTLLILENKKVLNRKEQIDLEILQEFRDDYILFDREIRRKTEEIVVLEMILDQEKDVKMRKIIMAEIKDLKKTRFDYIKDIILSKEMLYFLFSSALLYLVTTQISLNMNGIADGIVKFYQDITSIGDTSAFKRAEATVITNESLRKVYQDELPTITAKTELVEATGLGQAVKSLAHLNPVHSFFTGVETLQDKEFVGNVKDVYGEVKTGVGSGVGYIASGLGYVAGAIGSGVSSVSNWWNPVKNDVPLIGQ
jgi:hypothetical protein